MRHHNLSNWLQILNASQTIWTDTSQSSNCPETKAVWPTPTKKRKRKYGTDQWKMEKKTQTCGKGPTEGDRLSGHEMEVEESLLLHLGFVRGRAARGRSCLSPAWRKISSNTFLLLFSRKRKSIKLWMRKIVKYFFESQLFVC